MNQAGAPDSRTLNLKKASLRLSLFSGLFWWVFLWSGAAVGFRWLEQHGQVDRSYTFWMTVWSGFFAGFVATLSARLQVRRKLLIGRIEPSPQEWLWLGQGRKTTLSGSLWPIALLSGLSLACVTGAIQFSLSLLGDSAVYVRAQHVFYAGWLPALFIPFLVHFQARHSLRRFVTAQERQEQPLLLGRRRYLWLHNVLPYALFNASAGLVVAFSRFVPHYLRGESIDAHAIAWHLAMTAMVISLFVVAAARFKTRVDFLSPIILRGKGSERPRTWRLLYALVAPFLTYLILRLGFHLANKTQLAPAEALGLKLLVCLAFSLLTAHWAVSATLERLEHSGSDEHPYVRIHRFLRSTGVIDPFKRRRPSD